MVFYHVICYCGVLWYDRIIRYIFLKCTRTLEASDIRLILLIVVKVRMDLDLNNILADNLHYMTKDQYWYEFSRRYGALERCVTVHFCKEDEHCDRFRELLHVTFSTLEECRRRNIKPEHCTCLVYCITCSYQTAKYFKMWFKYKHIFQISRKRLDFERYHDQS